MALAPEDLKSSGYPLAADLLALLAAGLETHTRIWPGLVNSAQVVLAEERAGEAQNDALVAICQVFHSKRAEIGRIIKKARLAQHVEPVRLNDQQPATGAATEALKAFGHIVSLGEG